MKNLIIIVAILLFATQTTQAQYNRWAVDAEYGNHSVDDESAITVDKSTHFGVGLRYNFNPKVGLGLTAAFDNGTLEDFDGFAVDLDYSRVNLEAYLNVFKILDLHSNYFTIIAHGGPGFSKIESGSDYSENIFNIHGGVTGLLKLGNRVALKADFSTTGNISQSRTMDGSFEISNTGVNSTLHNISVGLVFYLGKKGKDKKNKVHADWYVAPPLELSAPLQAINNYPTTYVTAAPAECDCEYLTEEHIFFDHDKDNLSEEYDKVDLANNPIFKIFLALERNPEFTLIVKTWASDTESDNKYNLDLAKRRAKTLKDKFIEMGIDESRISTDPKGKDFDFSKRSLHGMARRAGLIIVKNK